MSLPGTDAGAAASQGEMVAEAETQAGSGHGLRMMQQQWLQWMMRWWGIEAQTRASEAGLRCGVCSGNTAVAESCTTAGRQVSPGRVAW